MLIESCAVLNGCLKGGFYRISPAGVECYEYITRGLRFSYGKHEVAIVTTGASRGAAVCGSADILVRTCLRGSGNKKSGCAAF